MAHHGYISLALKFMEKFEEPKILEIGVDRGQTTIPLAFWLSHQKKKFQIDCVDIRLDPSLEVILTYTQLIQFGFVRFYVQNSLEFLEKLDDATTYDVIFLDGDHNYFTVSRELEQLKRHIHDATIIIIDDYNGRWSERDLFYADRESHKDIEIATQKVETEKHGVKSAVDEFLENNKQFSSAAPIQGEPIVIFNSKAIRIG